MDLERMRKLLVSLPHVAEAEQFGGLVFWLADKAIGGKMIAMANFGGERYQISYPAGPERFHELLEIDGLAPAPYLARAHWVAAERWDVFRNADWEAELRAAHALTLAKMTPATRRLLALPKPELKRAIAERRQVLAEREKSKTEGKPSDESSARASRA